MTALTLEVYREVRAKLAALGHVGDWEWSQNVKPPATAEDLVCEYVWVVLNSGMRNTVARRIMDRVWPALIATGSIAGMFGHDGKRAAIERAWGLRAILLIGFRAALASGAVLTWCESLPWIGKITKYHLAKNLGADVAKPDRWLVRLAAAEGESVDALCGRLAASSGDRVATVDVVLWRACAVGVLRVVEGRIEIT